MKRIWTIAQRELRSLLNHPTGYVLLIAFVAINAFLFFRQAYLMSVASLRPMLDLLPWVFLLFVPAVTMRTLAEDTRSGLLELVLAQPLTEMELLLGKYIGAVLFLWLALVLTIPIPLGLSLGADMHWGPIVAQYVGAGLLSAGLAGVGVWASSLTRSQITAFILAVVVTFVLILVGLNPLIVGLPPTLGAVAAKLGVLSHFQNIGRGVIDLRDAIYFVSLAGVFLALAYGALVSRKLSRHGATLPRLRTGVGVLVAILIAVNLLGNDIGGRLDLTPGHAYTLSKATKQIVGGLDDIVTIKLFASDQLPTQAALLERDVNDLLRDLRSAGHGKIRVVRRDPTKDAAARSDAQSLGIQPVQFNVVGQSSLQVKQGYLGLAIQHGGKTQAIPFVQQTDDLEYRIVAAIRSLTRATKPVVAIVDDAQGPNSSVQQLQTQLAKSYSVRHVSLADSTQPATDVKALVLVGMPDSLPAGAAARLAAFFKRGGSALVLAGGMQINTRFPMASPRPVTWNAVLKPFGISVRSDMVYDLASNMVIPVPAQFGQVLQRYPFFIRAASTGASVVNQELDDAVLTWASSIDTTGAAAGTVTPLLVSSKAAGASTGATSIDPSRTFSQSDLSPRLLAVQVTPKAKAGATAPGRVIVVGNSDFVTDHFVQGAPENLAFALNAVDWLAQDAALISIRSKNRGPAPLAFSSASERDTVKYINLIGIPLLVALVGFVHLASRRRKAREPYSPMRPEPVGVA
ncbi:MAG TPA: Gldg family protein [Gemmatimonadaceae bacterium]|nr:Gldg family protein [Gemmatimonadaceae bacterium]